MNSAYLTIFEGCDGAGKSTIAKAYAKATNALYVHFGPLPHVTTGLGRLYVEAMSPALLGDQHVVFDRSWRSEHPYGSVFRKGKDRLGEVQCRMLERLAMRCGGVMVTCRPPWRDIKANFLKRRADEYLDKTEQLKQVMTAYDQTVSHLPLVTYDYTKDTPESMMQSIELNRMPCHPVLYHTAGNRDSRLLLVGESFAERGPNDPWYQWPFASFSGQGCSAWLTAQFIRVGIPEAAVHWVNVDEFDFSEVVREGTRIYALGKAVHQQLTAHEIAHHTFDHPQFYTRFRHHGIYPLLDEILAHSLIPVLRRKGARR